MFILYDEMHVENWAVSYGIQRFIQSKLLSILLYRWHYCEIDYSHFGGATSRTRKSMNERDIECDISETSLTSHYALLHMSGMTKTLRSLMPGVKSVVVVEIITGTKQNEMRQIELNVR